MKPKTFGETIKELREEKGLNLRGFAKEMLLSPTFISRLERGEDVRPSEEKVKRMAKFLGADENELLALAGRVSTELQDIIRKHPKELAAFLRTVDNEKVQPEDINKMTKKFEKK